ncbi:carbohydrate esterase family 5 protein [Atractiella rhizophila]|nr:carbohydrate esterase family 5 protein [Atractiella rhizophila]
MIFWVVIINTRGTGEPQGPSAGFRTMVRNTLAGKPIPGGAEHDTVYPAGFNQDSSEGTADILKTINDGVTSCPDQVYLLLGYSQGAAATVDAMPDISGAAFDKVAGVFLIGNPDRTPGKASNVDNQGGDSTSTCKGISSRLSSGISDAFDSSGKTLDVCFPGDGVCCGFTINAQHLAYPLDRDTQNLGTQFLTERLATAGMN